MILHPQHLVLAYDMLRQLPPFDKVKFPEADAIEFRASIRTDCVAEFVEFDPHIITIASNKCSHIGTLMINMAHEMIHLWQSLDGTRTATNHNADWHKKARLVGKSLGFDPLSI